MSALGSLRFLLNGGALLLCLEVGGVEAAESAPGDLVIPRKAGSMSADALPPSVFPHWVHRINFRCDACHLRFFEMELGATEITMDMMREGQSCGACHNGDVAFAITLENCARCHAPPAD